jgi:hypothetical protein
VREVDEPYLTYFCHDSTPLSSVCQAWATGGLQAPGKEAETGLARVQWRPGPKAVHTVYMAPLLPEEEQRAYLVPPFSLCVRWMNLI